MQEIRECIVLNKEMVHRTIQKLSNQILKGSNLDKLILVGIKTRGVFIAERIQKILKSKTGMDIPLGSLDINLYRDDLSTIDYYPSVGPSRMPMNINKKEIVLIDDVLFTGRTIRAALTEILDIGRPKRITLAVLVDRGHRELPISPDYIGATINTAWEESVKVLLHEYDKENDDCVILQSPNGKV